MAGLSLYRIARRQGLCTIYMHVGWSHGYKIKAPPVFVTSKSTTMVGMYRGGSVPESQTHHKKGEKNMKLKKSNFVRFFFFRRSVRET